MSRQKDKPLAFNHFPLIHTCGLLICASVTLTACSVGPTYVRPTTPQPSAWLTEQGSGVTQDTHRQWWQRFGSPELNSLIEKATHNNDDLAAAVARVEQADATARIAGASLRPQVDLGATATHARSEASSGGMQTHSQYSPLLSASYEIDFWGKNRAAREAAIAAAKTSRYDRATVELAVMTSVVSDYFQALALRDRISIAENNLKNAQTTLKGLQTQQSVGIITALDTAQQETAVATLYASIPPLKQQLRQLCDALAILTGQLPEAVDIPSGSLAGLTTPVIEAGLPSELLARRPDVAEAEAQLIAANANIKVARAAYFPSISLTANGGFVSNTLSTALSPANRVFSLAAGLTQPIFAGGAISGQYDYSKARYAELLADYHKTVISAYANVEDALVAVQQTAEQQSRQQAAFDKAQHAYSLANAQLHAGTVNILTVLSTQQAVFSSDDQLTQVKLAHLQALLSLYNALGGGWQQEESQHSPTSTSSAIAQARLGNTHD
ncbi:efflux transporter outer membrane subunit [Aquirhabdus parva]|uniref:RND transporter n=1 Tax=Aquirhabdus parva TaxID=2283318 RepID=A0A345P2Z7_9GAMM|nr:efflux transporter outer membrane subunit [Aquirhabdus parva]AXI01656.1 RND transporter [Aquirhabdus parva]